VTSDGIKEDELSEFRPGQEITSAKLVGLAGDSTYRVYIAAMTRVGIGEE